MRDIHAGLSDLKERIGSFEIDEKEKARKIEFLGYAIREIEAARLQPNEEEDLRNESALLQNSEKLFTEISASSSLLKGDGGIVQASSAPTRASLPFRVLTRAYRILETVRTSLYSLEDAAADLRAFEKDIQFSPERINQVEERLSLISSLRKKYGNTVREVLDYAEKSKRELDAISSSEEQIEKLRGDYRALVQVAKDTALDLSESEGSPPRTWKRR